MAKSLLPEISKLRRELVYCKVIESKSLHINKFLENKEKRRIKNYER